MLYEFQATYRTKGEAGPGPIQAATVRARSEEQALSFFGAPDVEVIWLEKLRVVVPEDQAVLNAEEAAELLKLTVSSFYSQVKAGVFPFPRDGKHRIPRAFIMKRLFKNIGEREVIA
jgi:excisionase family DNA binding protein